MADVPVNKSFGEFYRLCSIAPSLDLLTIRWKTVVDILSANSLPQLLELTRFLFNPRVSSEPVVSLLREKCLLADPSFPSHDADLELRVIAAVALLQTLDSGSKFSDILALGIISGACKGQRTLAPFSRLLERASSLAAARGIEIRKREPVTLGAVNLPKRHLEDLKKVAADPTIIRDGAAVAIQEAISGVGKVYDAAKTAVSEVDLVLETLAEETNILWWVLSEYSRDLNKPLTSLAAPTAALAVARELADLTCGSPGPRAAVSFLTRQLQHTSKNSEPVSLSDAIGTMTAEWRETLKNKYTQKPLDLCPVVQAVAKSTETDAPNDWHAAFQKITHLDASMLFEPIALSEQLFDEMMFLNALPPDR
jgi:hypothetical protein